MRRITRFRHLERPAFLDFTTGKSFMLGRAGRCSLIFWSNVSRRDCAVLCKVSPFWLYSIALQKTSCISLANCLCQSDVHVIERKELVVMPMSKKRHVSKCFVIVPRSVEWETILAKRDMKCSCRSSFRAIIKMSHFSQTIVPVNCLQKWRRLRGEMSKSIWFCFFDRWRWLVPSGILELRTLEVVRLTSLSLSYSLFALLFTSEARTVTTLPLSSSPPTSTKALSWSAAADN